MKSLYVTFATRKLEASFEILETGHFADKKLFAFFDRAIKDLKKEPLCGTNVQKRLWPKEYIKQYGITNLWKYDLPNGWRLIYTIKSDEVSIVSVILEWFDHKGYDKRFHY